MRDKETVRQALEELKTETITLLDNIKVLETEFDKIETDADAKNYDDLADKLTSGFKHIEIF